MSLAKSMRYKPLSPPYADNFSALSFRMYPHLYIAKHMHPVSNTVGRINEGGFELQKQLTAIN
jgi:hypothetical protein